MKFFKIHLAFIVIFTSALFGCSKSVNEKIEGSWAITQGPFRGIVVSISDGSVVIQSKSVEIMSYEILENGRIRYTISATNVSRTFIAEVMWNDNEMTWSNPTTKEPLIVFLRQK